MDAYDLPFVAFSVKTGMATKSKDWSEVAKLYASYGNYLDLIGVKPCNPVVMRTAVSIPHKPLFLMEV